MVEQLILDWLRRHANRNQRYGAIYYGWPFKAVMILGTMFFGVLVGIGLDHEVELTIVGCLAVFCILCFAGVLEALWIVIEYDDHYIYTCSPWRANRMIDWDDLVEVQYSYLAQWYVVRTKGSGNVRLTILLSGIGFFLKQLEFRGLSMPLVKSH